MFVGAILVWIHFLPHFKTVPEPAGANTSDLLLRRWAGSGSVRAGQQGSRPGQGRQRSRQGSRAGQAAAVVGLEQS